MNRARFFLKIGAAAVIGAAVASYAAFETKRLLSGPQIRVFSPPSGITTTEALAAIEGEVRNSAAIYLNDRPVFVDERGQLREKLLLQSGYNIITLRARDRFGREKSEAIELVFKPRDKQATTAAGALPPATEADN